MHVTAKPASLVFVVLFCWISLPGLASEIVSAADYRTQEDILYRNRDERLSEYMEERCRLDLSYPTNLAGFATVVWFHGGGLSGGNRHIPKALQESEIAIVAVNYRLSPKVKAPAYIDDAAAATAWVFRNIENYGGSKDRIFVAGHSAGGYLTSMVGLDKRWLSGYDIDADRIAGLIPFSGHTITHFTVPEERGIEEMRPVVDELAPLHHVRQDAPPILLITGDRNLELLGRYEENAYLWRMLRVIGHTNATLYELQGFNHGGMAAPAFPLLLQFVKEHSAQKD